MATDASSDVDNCDVVNTTQWEEDWQENVVSGAIIAAVSVIAFLWYCYVLLNMFRLTKKIPTFIIFFSQGIGDMGYLLNSLWLGIDIILGPTHVIDNTKLYSGVMNAFARPVLYHYLFIAIIRLIIAWAPEASKQLLTRTALNITCVIIWLAVAVEVAVLHVIWPTEAYVTQSLKCYGFYSQNLDAYMESAYVVYLNVINVVVAIETLLCYAFSIYKLKKTGARSSRQGRLLLYCAIDFVIVFTLYGLKAGFYLHIRERVEKYVRLLVQVLYTCTYAISAILLPVFSADLWHLMFLRKQPRSENQVKFANKTEAAISINRLKAANERDPAVTLERL